MPFGFGSPTLTGVQLKALHKMRKAIVQGKDYRSVDDHIEAEYWFGQAKLWAEKLPQRFLKEIPE